MSNDSLAGLLSLAGRALSTRVAEVLEPHDVSRGEYRILFALYREEGLSATELSAQHQLDKGVVTRVVTSLEEKGFLERRPDPEDGRRKLLYLTEQSEALRPEIAALKRELDAELAAGFSEQEIERLTADLRTVCANLGALPERGPMSEVGR